MIEYRIVGTKSMHHNIDGRDTIAENIKPIMSGYGSYTLTYTNKEDAELELQRAKIDLAFWEKKHNATAQEDKKYGVIIHWTDIHLESREVSEWEEVK